LLKARLYLDNGNRIDPPRGPLANIRAEERGASAADEAICPVKLKKEFRLRRDITLRALVDRDSVDVVGRAIIFAIRR
jgi:hypothetical protein